MKFASIGDFCVDTYPHENILGGTSYNSAIAARKFGASVSITSAIGKDSNGLAYQQILQKQHIDTTHLAQMAKPTSTVAITLDESNSPIFGKWNLGVLEDWQLNDSDLQFIKQHNVAKAILLKPLKKNFVKFCQSKMPHMLKAGDFAGDSLYSYSVEEISKYIDGLDVAIKSVDAKDATTISAMKQLAKQHNKIVLITLGEKGSICFSGEKIYQQPAPKITTTNTTGFGDTYIAVFLIEYFKTKDIQHAMYTATEEVAKSV